MDSDKACASGMQWRWVAAALGLACIVAMLPHVPVPYRDRISELCATLVVRGAERGSTLGILAWAAWAAATGVMTQEEQQLALVPITNRAWLQALTSWGMLVGALATAALPVWLLWMVGRLLSRSPHHGGAASWRRRLLADPALLVAAGWSLVLVSVVAVRVGSELLYPEPSLLLIPPLDGTRARIDAPASEWCPYSLHARRRECEVATSDMSRAFSADGYTFRGARCIPAPPEAWPAWRARLVVQAAGALTDALPPGTVVRSPYRIGRDEVDVAVLGDDPGGGVVLALDVADPSTDVAGDSAATRLAAVGVPNYWRVEVRKDRDPVLASDTLRMSSHPDAERGGYASTRASSRNEDLLLRVAALPAARVAIDDVLPEHPCPEPNAAALGLRPARNQEPAEASAFVTDGSHPAPSLVFEDFDPDGVARRVTFTAVSLPSADGFDPARSGITVTIAGPFDGEQVMNVVLPAGRRWTQLGGERPSWKYHDPSGQQGGITDLLVRTGDHGALSWELRGSGGSWRVSAPVIRDWGRLDLRLGPSGETTDGALAVFFLTGGSRPHCVEKPADTVTCRTPLPPEPCALADLDTLIRCSVEQLARAEELFFASHGRYFSGACDDLPLVQMPAGMSCSLVGSGQTFIISAHHPGMSFRTGCIWESLSEPSPIRCS